MTARRLTLRVVHSAVLVAAAAAVASAAACTSPTAPTAAASAMHNGTTPIAHTECGVSAGSGQC